MRDVFARAAESVRSTLGQDALLRGEPAGKVSIEHGVEVFERNETGEANLTRSVATIGVAFAPERGDTLELLDTDGNPVETWRIEGLHQDNGFNVRRFVSKVPD